VPTVLIVDDEARIRAGMMALLRARGYATLEAAEGREGLARARKENPAVILLDLRMPGMDGMETLRELRSLDQAPPVIVVTGYGEIDDAVQAMKQGAYDFLTKPPETERLFASIERAVEKGEMERRLRRLDSSLETTLEWMLGRGAAMKKVIDQVRQVAPSDLSVIIQGETGSGKSLVAQAIHAASPRADRPLVPVDMGTMADTLVESQLFGHEKGAFTGADRSRPGRLQEAMGGTLFIDELQNMTETVQRKMLLAVEKREIYPLGSGRARKIDVRILSATNLDLRRQVETAKFREDLFFRLGEFIIDVPPLRQRQDEIPELALKFIEESARQFCRSASGLEPEAAERLQHYSWPGNVRELKNAMKKAILVSSNGIVRAKDLDIPESEMTDGSEPVRTLAEDGVGSRGSLSEMRDQAVRDLETSMICEALNKAGGNKTRAAFALKVDYSTLLRKIKEYGIRCRVQSET